MSLTVVVGSTVTTSVVITSRTLSGEGSAQIDDIEGVVALAHDAFLLFWSETATGSPPLRRRLVLSPARRT